MKHAILIMAHGDLTVTENTLKLLDDGRFYFFVHMDKKSRASGEELLSVCRYSKVILTQRVAVYWGDYSQIEAEFILLKTALQEPCDYYHLISGADLPICTPDEFDAYFSQRKTKEYLYCWGEHSLYWRRINYRYPLLKRYRRSSNKVIDLFWKFIYTRVAKYPRKSTSRVKGIRLYAGDTWFSISRDCAEMICSKEKWVEEVFSQGYTVDELFVITLIMNDSVWKDRHCNDKTRLIDWGRGKPYVWRYDDVDYILSSGSIFCRKFDPAIDRMVIDAIYMHLMNKRIEKQ